MKTAGKTCPSCAAPMQARSFARQPLGAVEIDICFACHAIWFDQYESTQLAPKSVIDLFRLIHDHRDSPQRPVADSSRCPNCREALHLVHDIQRTNRISYYRCARCQGRFTTFFQFLREKNFVRSLSGAEIAKLRVTITQVRCSSCGAPVDVQKDSACSFCRAPLSILDADAVKTTLGELAESERRRSGANAAARIDAVIAGRNAGSRPATGGQGAGALSPWDADWGAVGVDLVGAALGALLDAID